MFFVNKYFRTSLSQNFVYKIAKVAFSSGVKVVCQTSNDVANFGLNTIKAGIELSFRQPLSAKPIHIITDKILALATNIQESAVGNEMESFKAQIIDSRFKLSYQSE